MNSAFPWRTALRIAWRESRASSAKFLFVALAVAAGVGSLTGVRGFSRAFRTMLMKEARTLMAADLSVRVFELPNDEQKALFDSLEMRGAQRTWITETVSMMASAKVADPVLVSVKAIDPARYPFYGRVRLEPAGTLAAMLTPDAVAVSEDLLVRLDVAVGDPVKLGAADFRIAAMVAAEPDRMAGSLNVGPRILLSRLALDRTGLLRPGSRAAQRHLFKLPPETMPVAAVRAEIKKVFPNSLIADFTETHPLITRGLDRATMFLSLVSLIALVVGALGVATAIQAHLQQKLDSIAVMKSIGARSGQIIRIYVTQTLLVAMGGAIAGLILGGLVQYAFPLLIARYFPLPAEVRWDWISGLEGLIAAVLTTLLFTLPPLLGIRRIRPSMILRREMAEEGRRSWRDIRAQILSAVAILLFIGLMATGLSAGMSGATWRDAVRVGAWFASGLLVSLLALSAIGWLLLRGLRTLLRRRLHLPATLRHGLANLYRPGNHAQSALVALGIGVMFTLSVYLIQHSLLAQISASAPPGMPNVFLLNITERERAGMLELLRTSPGIDGKPEIFASAAARLVSINGDPLERRPAEGPIRRFRQSRSVTWSAEAPAQTQILAGAWWKEWDPASPQVSVSEEASKILQVQPGASLQWTVSGRTLRARVAAIHKTEAIRPGSNIEFILTPGALDGVPLLYVGGARMRAKEIARLQREAYKGFPSVSVINVADVLDRVQEVVDQIAMVVRFIAAFSILAGVIILASSVAGTRFRRIREVVILKTLGATRRRVASIFSVEFLILGVVAGVMGSALATGFSALLLKRLLDSEFRFDAVPNLLAVLLTAVIANVAGWLASLRILSQKPIEALREE